MINRVKLARAVERGLVKLPKQVASKLKTWMDAVEHEGLEQVRKVPGYHDEPLSGARAGQRSFRLSRGWRGFYVIEGDSVQVVVVFDVNKHKY
jgi:proteic killer suppression protein